MGKIIYLPGVIPNPPSRSQMVEEVATILLKEVSGVFIEQRREHVRQDLWYRYIRDYLWRQEIKLTDQRDYQAHDLQKWKHYWRNEALNYIGATRKN